jgi:hypothetical protein
MFEMYIYKMGERNFVSRMAEFLDPKNDLSQELLHMNIIEKTKKVLIWC